MREEVLEQHLWAINKFTSLDRKTIFQATEQTSTQGLQIPVSNCQKTAEEKATTSSEMVNTIFI